MSATTTYPVAAGQEYAPTRAEVERLLDVLREYAEKLTTLNAEFVGLSSVRDDSRAAWLLDRVEVIRRPLEDNLARASALYEHGDLSPQLADEMNLRLREFEVQLHHAIRLAAGVQKQLQSIPIGTLRLAAGLSGKKGGPLRPQ